MLIKLIWMLPDMKSVEKFADFTCERYGHVDMLINNAGISGARGRIDKVNIKEAKKFLMLIFLEYGMDALFLVKK